MGYFVFGVLTVGGVCGGVFLKINDSFNQFPAEQIILTGLYTIKLYTWHEFPIVLQ